MDDKGVEPDSGGRAPESFDQESFDQVSFDQVSVTRETASQQPAKSAVSQLAGARLPLEAGSVGLGEDGHIQSAPADRPLSFRFAACGVQFEAEIAGRTAPLRLRANLGKLPYSAESPEARSLARVVLGASGRLRRGQILLTHDHDMMLEGEIAPPSPRTPARIIASAVALILDFQPYLDLLGEAVALRRVASLPPETDDAPLGA